MPLIRIKRCNRCGLDQPADLQHFGIDRRCIDNVGPYCRPCRAIQAMEERAKIRGGPPRSRIKSGDHYGRLTAIMRVPQGSRVMWLFRCECGKEPTVRASHVRTGKVVSCGCYGVLSRLLCKTTHGLSDTAEYQAWKHMKRRCENQDTLGYRHYGGRGIVVCERWKDSFENFLADVGRHPGPGYSLDRYPNNDGNYEPGNVRWATRRQQNLNRRNTLFVEWRGKRMPLLEACEMEGTHYPTAAVRLHEGWPVEKILHGRSA